MISTAKLRYLRIAPRKVRLVADLIRGERVDKAQVILNFTRKKAALPILKLLNQAVANAKNEDPRVEEGNLYIAKILVDEGPRIKRQLPRARGRADVIQKKTSHITLVLDEIEKKTKKKKPVPKKEKKTKATKKVLEKKEEAKKEKEVLEQEEIKKMKKRPEPKRVKPKLPGGMKRFFRRKAI